MKRSLINHLIDEAIEFAKEQGLALPPFAYWGVKEWEEADCSYQEIVDNMLGWDATDFGQGDFMKAGLVTFTFRNGNFNHKDLYPKPYAEKLLLVEDGQELPYHFHWSKMEDIINRGGGNLVLTLYNSDEQEGFADTDDAVKIDGRSVVIPAGGKVTLHPGESITLKQGQYHRWVGEKGTGKVMLFEVSMTNDDFVDNRFYVPQDRIPEVDEDEEIRHLIFADYKKYFGKGK